MGKRLRRISWSNKSSSLLSPNTVVLDFPWLEFVETISVNTVRGDQFCAAEGIKHIDFIHLDAQGSELKVLDGINLRMTPVGVIWLEVSTSELYAGQPLLQDVTDYMRRNGFMLYHLDMPGVQGDALFVTWQVLLRRPHALILWLASKLLNRCRRLSGKGA